MSAFQINLNPLKEPLGFIKILEWFAAIFTFATRGGFKGKTEILVSCPSKGVVNKTITAASGYPFRTLLLLLLPLFLWLVSSSAWAKALTDIKLTTGQNIIKELTQCQQPSEALCYFDSVTSMRSLNVSVIFGFLNMILWGGNAWFVYKETSLHSPSNTSASHSQGGVPPPSGI